MSPLECHKSSGGRPQGPGGGPWGLQPPKHIPHFIPEGPVQDCKFMFLLQILQTMVQENTKDNAPWWRKDQVEAAEELHGTLILKALTAKTYASDIATTTMVQSEAVFLPCKFEEKIYTGPIPSVQSSLSLTKEAPDVGKPNQR